VRLAFWGTPDFALPSLRALIGEGHEVVCVITQPDRPAGRGHALREPPVKGVAREERIPVLQPERARGPDFLAALSAFRPDLSVVVAFGQILRAEVLQLPQHGSINVHASLLPELRGAAPIQWSIMRGHTETGVTIMRITEPLDSGPILHQVREPIGPEETAEDLALRLSEIGAEALVEALTVLDFGELQEQPQDDALATYAPRITREVAHVNWNAPARDVANQIRGLDGVPGAWATWEEHEIKVYRPLPEPTQIHNEPPGTVMVTNAQDPVTGMLVACAPGAVWVREVKPAGKRRMVTAEWLRGHAVSIGMQLQ
jgi:methionyl-tRNA formyltransferase